ncbi:MAG: hypothetical protein HGB12_14110, partial [Bacteroidetes bacterium]|nr:hypothetical protein [Bacteroidota bacterium]
MQKEFVTYDIAKELKDLGFNEQCIAKYDTFLKNLPVEFKLLIDAKKNDYFIKAKAH